MERHILIVEDEEDIRDSLREVFENEGYQVSTANNGKHALEVSAENKLDLILLDLMMPVMSGAEFIQQSRSEGRLGDVPVIIMSADTNTVRKANELGVKHHVRKPLELEDLISLVNANCA